MLGALVQRVDSVVRWLCALVLWLALPAMLIPTSVNAALRYLSDSGLVWSEQWVNFLFPWFVMAGAGLAAQHSRHIGVQLLPSLIKPSAGRALRTGVHLVIVMACVVIVWYGYEVTMFERNTMFTLIKLSQAWSYLALLVGYTLIGLTSLTGLYRVIYDTDARNDFTTSVS